MVTVVMLVALRVTIGWHFLYEGVWKISHADKFSAQPFLTQAKGPAADLFYAMVPDLDGRERLKIVTNASGERSISAVAYTNAWDVMTQAVADKYKLDGDQAKEVEKLLARYTGSAQEYVDDRRDEILGHFDALDLFEKETAAGNNGAPFQKKRTWDKQQELRKEAGAWLSQLDEMGSQYRMALWDVLDDNQKDLGTPPQPLLESERLPVPLPVVDSRSQGLNLAVTYGLAAIGLCLMIGFFTRLASLGGVAFLFSVLLTQPPWPSIYPPAPEVVGHALIVDKNFVEMMAMLLLATTAVGRWAGLDFFIRQWLLRPMFGSRAKADK